MFITLPIFIVAVVVAIATLALWIVWTDRGPKAVDRRYQTLAERGLVSSRQATWKAK